MANDYVLQLENISKSFDGETILENFNLNVRKKEFVTLLGPSGCGKTTTLRLIGGFEEPEAGKIIYEGKDITNVPSNKRNINTVFQKYSLFMHMNIYENIAFGLKIKKTPKHIIDEKVKNALKTVNLSGYETRKPDSLSGGQQQRVAIARAIVNEPEILLLDEPLGALDLKLRQELQIELKELQKKLGITFIYVTHDQEEALTMSDTIVVMSKGKIQQIGTPTDVYNEPENAFVAQFIGHSNIFDATFIKDKLVKFEGREFDCVDTGFGEGEEVEVVLRPEDIKLSAPEDGQVKGVVKSVCFKGVHYDMMIESADGYKWQVQSTIGAEVGENVGMSIAPFDIHVMKKTPHDDF